jgi:hypothetical protein
MKYEIGRSVGVMANVGLAVLCLTVSAAVVKRVFWEARPQVPPGQVKAGDRVVIPNAKLGPGDTAVLVLREGCPYCKASAPLYKQLLDAARPGRGTRVIAALPGPVESARKYLASLGLDISDVYEVRLGQIHVRGTPTLLLLNEAGVVKRAWFGQQPAGQNAAIIRGITGGN